MQYTHLFFDLDRTLWDLDKNVSETLCELFDQFNLIQHGIPDPDSFWNVYNVHNKALWAALEKGEVSRDRVRKDRFVNILSAFKNENRKLAEDLAIEFLKISPTKPHLVPGATDILDHFSSRGYKLAIITNGFIDVQHIKIESSGLKKYFPHVITSESAGFQKPRPEIFYHALNLTAGDIRRSLMIGDSLSADIQGAINAGMDQVFYNQDGEKHKMEITYEISDLKELLRIC